MDEIKIAIMQHNPVMGEIDTNLENLLKTYNTFPNDESDVLITSECYLSGYPMEDLVMRPEFMDVIHNRIQKIAEATKGRDTAILLGTPWRAENGKVYNAAIFIENGSMQIRFKHHRPNYDVFDEKRIFEFAPLSMQSPIRFRDTKIGIMICEDIWHQDVAMYLAGQGAKLFLTIHGSPFVSHKQEIRESVANKRVNETGVPLVYVNQVGGQDELLFDGGSFVMNTTGVKHFGQFEAFTQCFTLDLNKPENILKIKNLNYVEYDTIGEIRKALVLGVRDYVNKTGFPGVVIGLSGGIDSAVAAAIAVEALGSARVHGILMPGPYSSDHSITDALSLADNLNIKTITVPIIDMYNAWKGVSEDFVNHDNETTTHENIQARSRGVVLMSYSNETGYMVLTTGNKSEMSVGYATLYGDMNGGFNALKDVYKTTVFALAENYNETSRSEVIPANTINKPPSAELAPDQEDSNTLPPYEILDAILRGLVEDEERICDIAKKLCIDKALVQKIQNMLYGAEFKRRQACPGTKITNRAFGKDRRYPIVNKYRD